MKFISRNKVSLIAIYEHRVRDHRTSSLLNKCMPGWEWATNASNNVRGRIWVVWNANRVSFEHKESSAQHLHGVIKMKQNDI